MSRFGGFAVGFPTQRTPASELDIYTVVSIFPKAIKETKVTLDPGVFEIPAGTMKDPGILHVGSSVWWRNMGSESEPAEVTVPAIMVADSIVTDYCNSLLGAKVGTLTPGLFSVKGRKEKEDILRDCQLQLTTANMKQRGWFEAMVKGADSLWARTNGNPVAIPDDARLAAQELGLKNKPWMQDFTTLEMVSCVNCGSLRNPAFPSCPMCRVIVDPVLFKKLGLVMPSVEVK